MLSFGLRRAVILISPFHHLIWILACEGLLVLDWFERRLIKDLKRLIRKASMPYKHLSLMEDKGQVLVVLDLLILNVDHSLLGSLVDLESGQSPLS